MAVKNTAGLNKIKGENMKKNNLIFLSIIIFGAVALGVIGLCIGLSIKKSDRKPSGNVVVMPSEDIVSDNDENKLNDGDFHPMPEGMLFAYFCRQSYHQTA